MGGPVGMASSYAMPAYADPAGPPPTAILSCEYDDVRGSSELFVSSLEQAGVPVAYFLAEGAVQGHLEPCRGHARSIARSGIPREAAGLGERRLKHGGLSGS